MARKFSLTDLILLSMEKAVDGVVRANDYAYHSYIYAAGYDRPLKKSALSQAIKRLREKGFIETEKNTGEILIKLTSKGFDRAVLLSIHDNSVWDGRWRIVIFDIPEKKRAIRSLLRRKLKEWGFTKWQRSVWASKKNCTKQLRDYIKLLKIEDWVLVIESDNVGKVHKTYTDRL